MPAQIYLVDAFGSSAASALAANTVLRSLGGTFLPLAGPKMNETLGLGMGKQFIGILGVGFCSGSVLLLYIWGASKEKVGGEIVGDLWVYNKRIRVSSG